MVPEPEVEATEADLEFFRDNADFGAFLSTIDPNALSQKKPQKKKVKQDRPTGKEISEDDLPSINSASDSGEDEDDLAFANVEDLSDESDLDETHELSLNGHSRDSEVSDDSDDEQQYEKQPRLSQTKKDKESKRLPIKLKSGLLQQVAEESSSDQADSEDLDGSDTDADAALKKAGSSGNAIKDNEDIPHTTSITAPTTLLEKKEELAAVASKVMEDPEANIGRLKRLRELGQDSSPTVQKLALLTQLAVYKDIIPGYRIRPASDKEREIKVSKDVKKLRNFEEALLKNYQAYLQALESYSRKKDEMSNTSRTSLRFVAVQCMCDLLTSVTYFNFRLNLLTAIVTQMSSRTITDISRLCADTVIALFRADVSGEASLDAVRLISRMIKDRGIGKVHPDTLKTFLSLRLKDELGSIRASSTRVDAPERPKTKVKKPARKHLTKRAKKELQDRKEVEKELKEAEAVVDREEKEKLQTETLKIVFVTYFRILKQGSHSDLLPVTLEGLAKFAHMINVDFFQDLLSVLREIIANDTPEDAEGIARNRQREVLLCIVTAFELLSGQGEALNIDLHDFINHLYALIPQLANMDKEHSQDTSSTADLIHRAIGFVFFKHRQAPIVRIMSFYKRLLTLTVAMPAPSSSTVTLLTTLCKVLLKYPKLEVMMQSDAEEGGGIGVAVGGSYRMDVNDPELCNPGNAKAWELGLLERHFDPKVRVAATLLADTQAAKRVITA